MDSTGTNASTASYLELAGRAYGSVIDAYAAANKSALEYAKSFWAIAARPYSTPAVEAAVTDAFERARELASLTIAELQANGRRAGELAEQLADRSTKLQESYAASLKGLVDTSLSNLNYVKDTSTHQFESLAGRLDEMRKNAVTTIGVN